MSIALRILVLCSALLCGPVVPAGGYAFEAVYTADLLRNAAGGIRTSNRYLDNLDLTLEVDVAEAWGRGSGTLFVYGLYNNGTTFADELVGDLLVTSNIDAPGSWRIYELWYEFGDELWSVKTGLYDLNSEFDVNRTGGLFLSSAHGIGAAFSQTGENGPSIFPVTSLALRAAFEVRDATLRLAVLDGVPGDPDDPSSNEINLGGEDGALLVGEVEMPFAESARAWVGYWRYIAEFERPFDGGRSNDNGGWYLGVESGFELWSRPAAWFVRYGRANESLNPLQAYLGGGVVIDGIIASRPEDQLGLSVASGRSGAPWQAHLEQAGAGAAAHETEWELTYRAQINEHLALQPDLQYVQNPAASQELENAWIVGLRFELAVGGE
jgi:porin